MPDGELGLAPRERKELRDRVRSRTLPAEDVRRARLILLLAQGKSYLTIRQLLGCNPNYISRWKGRFEAERLAGLYSRHRGRAVEKRTPALEARILEWTRRPAPDGSTHWSSRKLASDDPDFELKAADIIGLYVQAALTCGGVLRRRKDRHPGPGSARSGAAAVAGATGAPRL